MVCGWQRRGLHDACAPLPCLIIENRPAVVDCPFARGQRGDEILHHLIAPGQALTGYRELRDFTRDTKKLMIIDPYWFDGDSDDADRLSQLFQKSARIDGPALKHIHVVHHPDKITKSVARAIENVAKTNNVKLTTAVTKEIHDRVWIADRKRAVVVGTSFNGIGNRAAFILDLPEMDLKAILEFLDVRGLSRTSPKKTSTSPAT